MDAINALIAARVTQPSGISSGEVPVWNGTTWVRSGDGVGTGINASGLHGFPNDPTKVLLGDGTWGGSAGSVYARKNTALAVTNTVTETDLLNGEITLGANALGTTKLMRISAWGDGHFGASQAAPRFKFKMGAGPTVVIDTGTASTFASSANRIDWEIVVKMVADNATNAQWVTFDAWIVQPGVAGTASTGGFTAGEGVYSMPTASASGTYAYAKGGIAAAIDTTLSNTVILSVIMGSATSSDFTLKGAIVEVI